MEAHSIRTGSDEKSDDYVPSSEIVKTMRDQDVSMWFKMLIGSDERCTTADSRRKFLQTYLQKKETDALEQVESSARTSAVSESKNSSWIRMPIKYVVGAGNWGYKHLQKTIQTWWTGTSVQTHHEENFRPEARSLDSMTYVQRGNLLRDLSMDVTNSPEDDKLRLQQRLFSGQWDNSYGQKMRGMLNETVKAYKDMKEKLHGCYEDVIAIIRDTSFKAEMRKSTQCRFPGFERELESKRKILQNLTDTFEIVFTGETSSGKSTFLNVLLGQRILPSHILHTTACICRLHNGMDGMIEYRDENGFSHKIHLGKDSSKLREELELMTKKLLSNDGEHEPLRTSDVYWEIPSLHENVVLVDTPGIGETDALTEQVMEYVSKADGYVFIVDSVRAGGIQDGGIKKLIEVIAKSARREEQIANFSNVFFVCNKWDLVEREHRNDVMQNTKKKLAKIYGHLEDWQVVEFNSALELQLLELKANASDTFSLLLKSLETLMSRTIKKRLEEKYRWLQNFVMDVEGFMNARMYTEHKSKEEVEAKIQHARKELNVATEELEKSSEIQTKIDTEKKELSKKLRKYLESDDVKSKLLDWTNGAPKLKELKTKGPELIKTRLQDVILEWTSAETSPLKEASAKITGKFKEVQAKIDARIRAINQLELGFNMLESSLERVILDEVNLATFALLTPAWLFVVVAALVLGLLTQIGNFFITIFMSEKELQRMSIERMSRMTEEALNELLKKDYVEKMINDCFTCPHSNWLTKFRKNTQRKIDSTHVVMTEMEIDLQRKRDIIAVLKPLHTKLQKCSECLEELKKCI